MARQKSRNDGFVQNIILFTAVSSNSDEPPIKMDPPLLINQGFIHPVFALLVSQRWHFYTKGADSYTIQQASGSKADMLYLKIFKAFALPMSLSWRWKIWKCRPVLRYATQPPETWACLKSSQSHCMPCPDCIHIYIPVSIHIKVQNTYIHTYIHI